MVPGLQFGVSELRIGVQGLGIKVSRNSDVASFAPGTKQSTLHPEVSDLLETLNPE